MRRMINLPTPAGRDRTQAPSTIIIHAMAEYLVHRGKTYYAVDFLNEIGLSCHYMVTPGGDVIECANPSTRTTWHARGHNSSSIGVEILVPGEMTYEEFKKRIDQREWWTPYQLKTSAELCRNLRTEYRIPMEGIVRHSDIDPNRKSDPGTGFPWESFLFEVEF